MRRRRGRWLAIGVCAVLVTAALVAISGRPDGMAPPTSPPVASASSRPSIGPVVFYEVLDADAARLIARTLDGRSLPREVAARVDANGPAWTVDPTGSIAIASTADAALGPGLVAVDTATGAQRWATPTKAAADLVSAVWSPDGRRMAALVDDPDPVRREIVIVDAATGAARVASIPEDAYLQGFTPDGALILRRHVVDETTFAASWRFLRIEPSGLTAAGIAGFPDVQPAGDGYEAAAPRVRMAVDQGVAAGQAGATVRAWDLEHDTSRVLATFPSLDRIVVDPAGTGVAVSVGGAVRFVTFDGLASDVFAGADSIADVDWSAAGDYLVVTADQPASGLTVVERASGRSVAIPPVGPALSVRFVAMPGGVALPPEPLPAAEPTPTPTPGPSGADVTGFGGILVGWVDESTGRIVVHAQRLVPTEAGGLRVAADLPPIDLGPVNPESDATPGVTLLPRPGSTDVLVVLSTADGTTMRLWSAAAAVAPYPLPADWPAAASDPAWRPDGHGIAASTDRPTADGGFETEFVVAADGDRRTTVVPAPGPYDRLEGWWSTTELRVRHGPCVEACAGRYAEVARLRIADRHLTQLTPADRATAPIDDLTIDGDQLVLSMITGEASDDLRIDWPVTLGPATGVTPIGPVADARDLLVSRSVGATTDLYRVADVVGRARDGRLSTPDPVLVTTIAGHELELDVSPGGGWALVTDRVLQVRLIRLADGRAWPVDQDRILTWAGR